MVGYRRRRNKYLIKGGINTGEAIFDGAVEKNIPGAAVHGGKAARDFYKAYEVVKAHDRRINGRKVHVKSYPRKRPAPRKTKRRR